MVTAAGGQEPGRPRDLDELRALIARLNAETAEVSALAGDLLGRAARTRLELQLQAARVAEAETALATTRAEIADTEASLQVLEVSLAEAGRALRRRLAAMASYSRHGYLRLLLAVDRGAEPVAALRLLRYLVRRDAEVIAGYRDARDSLESRRSDLAGQQVAARNWVDAEATRRVDLDRARREQRRVLADLEVRRRRLLERTQVLGEKEARLGRLLEVLAAEGGSALDGVPIQEFRGALAWPAAGRVTVGFGPRRDPTYGTSVPHNGVEIEVAQGTAVNAIYRGRVLFAAPFQDLGFAVVVEHPGRALTLYANLSALEVAEGDVVGLNAIVGRSDGRLYFEIRIDRQPQDPREWLL